MPNQSRPIRLARRFPRYVLAIVLAASARPAWLEAQTQDCASLVPPLASPAEVRATPRALPELEQVAIKLDGTFVARESTYARLARDVQTLRANLPNPPLALSTFTDLRQFTPAVDGPGLQALVATGSPEWDCLLAWYPASRIDVGANTAILEFEGVFDLDVLGLEFESRIPQILMASRPRLSLIHI